MKMRFKRNTVYEGESYGPSYASDVAEVKPPFVARFIAQSRAEPITEEEIRKRPAASIGLPDARTREERADAPARCEAETASGSRCRKKAVEGSTFCAIHGE